MTKFGMCVPDGFWSKDLSTRHAIVAELADVGFDHMYMADHVSFRNGSGTDGFVEVAALAAMHPSMGVMISIYLLPLRHPLPVARQLATMAKIAPGRFIFGIGIGGEDRHEVEVCGVDPRTRGRRTNDSLSIIRGLMRGDTVDHQGEFFQLEQARIRPRIKSAIPILVGGRSDAALTRAATYGEGWIGVWCSAQRYAAAVASIQTQAESLGREPVSWLHGYQPWVGVGQTKNEARALVAKAMEAFYHVPFEKFERYIPYGTPQDVAAELQPYVDAGCGMMNLKVVAANTREEMTGAAAVRRIMLSTG